MNPIFLKNEIRYICVLLGLRMNHQIEDVVKQQTQLKIVKSFVEPESNGIDDVRMPESSEPDLNTLNSRFVLADREF